MINIKFKGKAIVLMEVEEKYINGLITLTRSDLDGC